MGRYATAVLCGLALSVGAVAQAQQPATALPPTGMLKSGGLFLVNGDRAVFAMAMDGRATLVAAGPAPPMTDQKDPAAGLNPGQISFALTKGDSGNTLLVVASRAPAPFRYQARIVGVRDGKVLSAPASTCPVAPGRSGLENWPQLLPAVVIVSFEPATPDDTACR